MNSSADVLTDFKSAKSNLRKIASFPVCSFSSMMADFAFSSLRAAMYTFALRASNACVFCQSHGGLFNIDEDLPSPFLFQSLFKIRQYLRTTMKCDFATPVFAPVTMITFPVKSGTTSSTLNSLWGGKLCEIIEVTMPIFSIRERCRGRKLERTATFQPYKQ